MREYIAPDATVRLSWFRGSGADFISQSEKMVGRGDATTHRLSAPVVDVVGERAVVELPATIEMRTVVDGVEADLLSHARLIYRVERRSGRWVIVAMDPVYERDTLEPSRPDVHLVLETERLDAFRPSYRFLSYLFSRLGYEVGTDLFGDDEPEAVAELYRSTFDWLRG
jgi:hypothetical protein